MPEVLATRPMFLRVGGVVLGVGHIVAVDIYGRDGSQYVDVYMDGLVGGRGARHPYCGTAYHFSGEDAVAFLRWFQGFDGSGAA